MFPVLSYTIDTHTDNTKKCSMNTHVPFQTLRNHFPVIYCLAQKKKSTPEIKPVPVIFYKIQIWSPSEKTGQVIIITKLRNFPKRFGVERIFLLHAHVDPVVHFTNSASV